VSGEVELEEVSVEVSEEEVSEEEVSEEEVSEEGAEVVSVVEALLAGVVSVLVVRTESDSPNAPEAISPNANRTASPIPIRRDRFRSVRWTFSVPCRALSLITLASLVVRPPEPHPTRRRRAAPGGRVKLEKIN
jgi:hypothetical protein